MLVLNLDMGIARALVFTLLCASLAACAAPLPGSAAPQEDESWQAFGHALALVQSFVHKAAESDDPQASLKAIEEVLSGRNPEANRAFAGLMQEATAGMPDEQREKVASLGRDFAALARKEIARAPAQAPDTDRALQARKDLTEMGLRYYDKDQFLDAVKRNDALAVELYLAGEGVNPSASGGDGRTALQIAQANGNQRIVALLSRNLPAKR
jgi:hypothetical protein